MDGGGGTEPTGNDETRPLAILEEKVRKILSKNVVTDNC